MGGTCALRGGAMFDCLLQVPQGLVSTPTAFSRPLHYGLDSGCDSILPQVVERALFGLHAQREKLLSLFCLPTSPTIPQSKEERNHTAT